MFEILSSLEAGHARPSTKAKKKGLTKSKAQKILHDKSVRGHPLTDKQRRFFGWVAGAKKRKRG